MQILSKEDGRVVIQFAGDTLVIPFKVSDSRRSIFECPYGPGVIQFFQLHDDSKPLGVHCHCQTREEFFIISGGGYVVTAKANNAGQPIDYQGNALEEATVVVIRRSLKPGATVLIEGGLAHAFYLQPGSEMVCVASLPYDPDDVFPTPWLVKNFHLATIE